MKRKIDPQIGYMANEQSASKKHRTGSSVQHDIFESAFDTVDNPDVTSTDKQPVLSPLKTVTFADIHTENYDDGNDLENIDQSICHVCQRKELKRSKKPDKAQKDKWIGCDDCPRWYHLVCIELFDELGHLSEKELEDFNYSCKMCN